MLNVAIIPARGGSKGVPKKNLKKVNGISLLGRAVNSSKVNNIDKIFVSTDDHQIKKEALRYGAEVPFYRSKALSNDDAIAEDVIKDVIEKIESFYCKKINHVVYLEPTSPFRNREHVTMAIDRMLEGKFNSIVSVCPLERKPENIFRKSNVLYNYIVEPNNKFNKRQDMNKLCRLNSAIYVFRKNDFIKQKKLIIDPIGWIEMTQEESINIDTHLDLNIARSISKNIDKKLK
jgi:CMP-N,N'-diacetyllegionaminic acid synthase|tara:strand:+ start:372 stop:1070 length:699 start_codon:yes stop_codon:yes gene_type:complete